MSEGNWTLNDVDESLWHVVFLEDIANDQWKADCLETFARCKDIVKWLKKETKGEYTIRNIIFGIIIDLVHLIYRCERDSALCEYGSGHSSWWRGRLIT